MVVAFLLTHIEERTEYTMSRGTDEHRRHPPARRNEHYSLRPPANLPLTLIPSASVVTLTSSSSTYLLLSRSPSGVFPGTPLRRLPFK
eukprot:scaffold35782_cov39-Tisochrysis_lutea.AAC.1